MAMKTSIALWTAAVVILQGCGGGSDAPSAVGSDTATAPTPSPAPGPSPVPPTPTPPLPTPSPAPAPAPLERIYAGITGSCAIRTDGSLDCWGENIDQNLSALPTTAADARQLVFTHYRTCLLKTSGAVICTGDQAQAYADIYASAGSNISQIAMSDGRACALSGSGSLRCWVRSGDDSWSELPAAQRVASIRGSQRDICAVTIDGGVLCTLTGWTAANRLLTNLTNATQVAPGENHGCAVLADRTVSCWGGAVVVAGTGLVLEPIDPLLAPPSGLRDVDRLEVMANGACARLLDATLRCWGNELQEAAPAGLVDVVSIHSSGGHVCALTRAGDARCWGGSSSAKRHEALAIRGVRHIASNAIGVRCVVDANSAILCWQNGLDAKGLEPRSAVGDVRRLALTSTAACALSASGSVQCWGTGAAATTPSGASAATDIVGGTNHACALLADRSVRCWGEDRRYNNYAADPVSWTGPIPKGSAAVAPSGLSEVRQLIAGDDYSCALRTGGALVCWGANRNAILAPEGATGDQLYGGSEAPPCLRRANGVIECWGEVAPVTGTEYAAWLGGLSAVEQVSGNLALTADGRVHLRPGGGPPFTEQLEWPAARGSVARLEGGCAVLGSGNVICQRDFYGFAP